MLYIEVSEIVRLQFRLQFRLHFIHSSLGGVVRAVIGLLHSDLHQRGTVGSICHLATSVITVAPGTRGLGAVAKITRRTKSGKLMQDVRTVEHGVLLV